MIESAIQTPAPAPEATAKVAQGSKPGPPGEGSVTQLFFELLTSSLAGGLAGGGVSPETGFAPPAEAGVELKPPRSNDRPEATQPRQNNTAQREIKADQRLEAQRRLDETRQRPEGRATGRDANRSADKPSVEHDASRTKPVDSKVTARPGPVPVRMASAAGKPDQRQPAGSTVVAEKSAASSAAKGLRVWSQSGGENAKSETTQMPALQAGALAAEPRQKQDAARMPGELELIQKLLNRSQAKVAPDAVRSADNPTAGNRTAGEGFSPQPGLTEAFAAAVAAVAKGTASAVKPVLAAALRVQAAAAPAAKSSSITAFPGSAQTAIPGRATARATRAVRPAQAQLPLPAERVMKQVVRAARISVGQGREEIKLLLKPDSLGWLKIKISIEGHSVTARITVEHEGVRDLIESNVKQLQQALQNQNLRVNQIVVQLQADSNPDHHAQQPGGGGNGAGGSNEALTDLEDGVEQEETPDPCRGDIGEGSQVDVRV